MRNETRLILQGTRHECGFYKTAFVVGECEDAFPRISAAMLEDDAVLKEIHSIATYRRVIAPRAGIYIVGGYSLFPSAAIGSLDPEDKESIDEAYEIEYEAFANKRVPVIKPLIKKTWRYISC